MHFSSARQMRTGIGHGIPKAAAAPLDVQAEMQILVINCAQDREALAFQTKQFERLDVPFHRVDAYTPETLPTGIKSSYWKGWRRPRSDREKARFLSHSIAWERVAATGPALIVEDLTVLVKSIPEIISNLEGQEDMDHLSLEARGGLKLMGNASMPIAHGISCHRLYLDPLGASAYVLWPSGARKLLERASQRAASPEGLPQWVRSLRSYQTDPACAVRMDEAYEMGFQVPQITSHSSYADDGKRLRLPLPSLRKARGRVLQSIRHTRYGMMSRMREVAFRPEFFDY